MPCPNVPLRATLWSLVSLLVTLGVPAQAEEHCARGPAGPHDREYLSVCRPEPVSAAVREQVVRSLPVAGVVTQFTVAERAKIAAVADVLRFHRREAVYETRVVEVQPAWTGLHGRSVLLISVPALKLLTSEELQGLVAHEIGHEYLHGEYAAARAAHDEERLRSVETACDAVAALTLQGLGIPPARFASALEKVHSYNRSRFGIALNDRSYPAPKERRRLLARFSGGGQ